MPTHLDVKNKIQLEFRVAVFIGSVLAYVFRFQNKIQLDFRVAVFIGSVFAIQYIGPWVAVFIGSVLAIRYIDIWVEHEYTHLFLQKNYHKLCLKYQYLLIC